MSGRGWIVCIPTMKMQIVLFRGLRLKAGVDIGAAITDIQRPTGRITYRWVTNHMTLKG
jgi:hypothetical protein